MRVRDDDFTEEEEEEDTAYQTQPEQEAYYFQEPIPGTEKEQSKHIFVRAVAGAYRALNNWLSGRTNVEFSDEEAEHTLAASVVEWAWKDNMEITPFQTMLLVHTTYYGPRLIASRANGNATMANDQVEEDSVITEEDE